MNLSCTAVNEKTKKSRPGKTPAGRANEGGEDLGIEGVNARTVLAFAGAKRPARFFSGLVFLPGLADWAATWACRAAARAWLGAFSFSGAVAWAVPCSWVVEVVIGAFSLAVVTAVTRSMALIGNESKRIQVGKP